MLKACKDVALRRHLWPQVLGVALLAACTTTSKVEASTGVHKPKAVTEAVRVLAERLARDEAVKNTEQKTALIGLYEAAYGPVGVEPEDWEAAVRRSLICDAIGDLGCLQSSLKVIDIDGGLDVLPLDQMQEVTRFLATPASIKSRVIHARGKITPSSSGVPSETSQPAEKPTLAPPHRADPLPAVPRPQIAPLPHGTSDYNDRLITWAALAFVLGGAGVGFGATTLWERKRAARQNREREAEERVARELDRKAEAEARDRMQRAQLDAVAAAAERVAAAAQVPAAALAAHAASATSDERPSVNQPETLQEAVAERPPQDPRFAAACRLLDALHRAERDVDPFLGHVSNAVAADPKSVARRHVLISWHEAIRKARNDLCEIFAKHGWEHHSPVTVAPRSAGEAMQRLMDHAALFSTLLQAQNKESSAIYHWSKILPGAALQLYWSSQTLSYAKELKDQPMPSVSYAPGPDMVAAQPAPPAPSPRTQPKDQTNDFYARAVLHATAGGRHAA